jgi:hypothetical protein
MTAIKTSATDTTGVEAGGVSYHFTTPHGEHYRVSRLPAAGGQPALIKIGSASNYVVMSQSNLSDIIAALDAFASGGTYT